MSTEVTPLGENVARAMDFSPSKLEPTPPQQQATDEEAESIALALRLQEEDNAYAQSWGGGAWSAPSPGQEQSAEPADEDDEASIALAIRLQQEDDDAQLRATLGLAEGEEMGDPDNLSYEQLLRLNDTVGTVSRGASSESVEALKLMTVAEARADPSVRLGEQV